MAHHEAPCCQGIAAAMDAAPKSVGGRMIKLVDLFKANKEALKATFPTENEMVEYGLELYDRFIKPIDIKFIPDWMEEQIDTALKAMLDQMIRAIYPG